MVKIQILTRCKACEGQAYLPSGTSMDAHGLPYTRYAPCSQCEGTGQSTQWISMQELALLLAQVQPTPGD